MISFHSSPRNGGGRGPTRGEKNYPSSHLPFLLPQNAVHLEGDGLLRGILMQRRSRAHAATRGKSEFTSSKVHLYLPSSFNPRRTLPGNYERPRHTFFSFFSHGALHLSERDEVGISNEKRKEVEAGEEWNGGWRRLPRSLASRAAEQLSEEEWRKKPSLFLPPCILAFFPFS